MLSLVEVAVSVPVRGTFTYSVPPALGAGAQVGSRVLVPFGPSRGVMGVIIGAASGAPAENTREVRELLDDLPPLDPALVDLCLWIADYYEAPPGEVVRTALPPGTSEGDAARLVLGERGRAVLDGAGGALPESTKRALIAVAAGRAPRVTAEERAALIAAGLLAEERVRLKPRAHVPMETVVRLLENVPPSGPRRAAILAALAGGDVPLRELGKGAAAIVKALAREGVVETYSRPRALAARTLGPVGKPLEPTPGQAAALAILNERIDAGGFQDFLLHGVTGSGKTEVYMQAIARVLARGRGALVLVPEISLTPQLSSRFRGRFGDDVVVLHSGLGDAERIHGWRRLAAGEARIAVGARSAVFAPVRDVGIVVVDEEHDPSFKQEEGVRYHARDVALVRAQRAGAVCVLGSATPSLETYQRALDGRCRLIELPARAHAKPMPAVEIVDLRTWQPDPETFLTAPLTNALADTLAAGDQAILFLNRRGFATFVVCCACGGAFRCRHCSVSLTYHRDGDALRCHYCDHREPVPKACPGCHAQGRIRRFGLGTERLEHALRARFPAARIGRLDRDTAKGMGATLRQVERRELDILVGTQMVTKGHDFPGVTLVGVLLADGALSLPDFRAAERTFQLLTQVAGRAGRGERPGRVVIQAYSPDHHAVTCAAGHDYQAFFAAESAARAELGYPPHGRLFAIRIDGSSDEQVGQAAARLAARAERRPPTVTVLGPAEAPLKKLKGRTRWHMWVKGTDRPVLRAFVRHIVAGAADLPRDVRVTVDVDPISAL
jgi:primosomal protein N' (replication factor Y) (superfamily II helicase)